mmetsp:Transcript_10806/g.27179  ORF Transcript_10806/g.27179 Transcript_10806/m.27179 type:complete len:235 (+) Transcript_10806:560-1264(+)
MNRSPCRTTAAPATALPPPPPPKIPQIERAAPSAGVSSRASATRNTRAPSQALTKLAGTTGSTTLTAPFSPTAGAPTPAPTCTTADRATSTYTPCAVFRCSSTRNRGAAPASGCGATSTATTTRAGGFGNGIASTATTRPPRYRGVLSSACPPSSGTLLSLIGTSRRRRGVASTSPTSNMADPTDPKLSVASSASSCTRTTTRAPRSAPRGRGSAAFVRNCGARASGCVSVRPR